jgi:uncharacterized membrane protein
LLEHRRSPQKEGRLSNADEAGLTKSRIEALADGVFAVAMTLLVFEIKVPGPAQEAGAGGLARHLASLWPNFVSYAISFFVLGIYWVGHHNQFHFIRRSNRPFLWLNIVFLFFVTLIPFSAALISMHFDEPIAIAFYGGNLIAVGLVLYAIWVYATSNGRLVDKNLPPEAVRRASRRILISPCVFAVAVAIGFFNTKASLILYAATASYYFFPGDIDLHWKKNRGSD